MSTKAQQIQALEKRARELGLSAAQVQHMKEAIMNAPDEAPVQPQERGAGVPFGTYTLTERLGNGVLSKMYRAQDSQGKEVALKIMRPDFMKSPYLERFDMVAQRMVGIFHQNWIILLPKRIWDMNFHQF